MMKVKTMLPLLSLFALTPAACLAFGNHSTWSSGWNQGITEFTILGKGQSQFYLACDSEGASPATLIYTDMKGHQVSMDTGAQLQVKIDGNETIDISESGSRAGENNLALAWTQLRNGTQVTVSVPHLSKTTFTLKGARQALPEFGTHGCVSKASL